MANHVAGKIAIGSAHSIARYKNANQICAECFMNAPEGITFLIRPTLAFNCVEGECYVCEQWKFCKLVESRDSLLIKNDKHPLDDTGIFHDKQCECEICVEGKGQQ